MRCYQYTSDGYFAGADEDYGLLPNNATYDAPACREGYVPRWTGEAWEQVEDHTGAEGWLDGLPHRIAEPGPLPAGWSETPPEPEPLARRDEIMARLTEIDWASVRPLRAISSGDATDFDRQKLADLDAEARELRDELSAQKDGDPEAG